MINGRMVTTCPMDGGAGDDAASVQILEKGKEKQESPTRIIGRMTPLERARTGEGFSC